MTKSDPPAMTKSDEIRDRQAGPTSIEQWRSAWPLALAAWSKFTRLRDARLCQSSVEAAKEGLGGSFAMIRLVDQSVVVDLELVEKLSLTDYAVEILAHEIGHHVLAPASVTDQFRLLARIRRALPTLPSRVPLVANLYTDLYVNDRLQRRANLRMAEIYQGLAKAAVREHRPKQGEVWMLYMRIYELLWGLDKGHLGGTAGDSRFETDAWLGARLIRVYANDWLRGAGRFATLLLPYLVEDQQSNRELHHLLDTRDAAQDCEPSGIHEIEADEIEGIIHPIEDPSISGLDDEASDEAGAAVLPKPSHQQPASGQFREPFEYGEILKTAGIRMSDHDIAVRYYRERAFMHLVRFPTRKSDESPEPQMEGLEPWDIGDPPDSLDWMQTILQSPKPIPGMTTVRRTYGREPARDRRQTPVDLDLYVDSSGSMPNPQVTTSFLALAGAIVALSAIRAGSRVQATLWSGKGQVTHTSGFVRDETAILRVVTGFYGGGTAFPIHRLRDTYAGLGPHARPVHILMISDDGITTMFDSDELGNSGWDIAGKALATARGGGTMALNLPGAWEQRLGSYFGEPFERLKRARREQAWDIHAIARLEDLLEFARSFSRRNYAADTAGGREPRQ